MLDNQQQINNAINYINTIEALVKEVFSLNQNAFEGNKLLSKSFSDFFLILKEAKNRLSHPVLSLAMIGTTSAGKSTIANALSGCNVAPIESKEMSAGVLKFVHCDSRSINILKTKGARWQCGLIKDIGDDEMRRLIVNIYDKYKTYIKTAAAPEIVVSCPLKWQTHREILDLPSELSVEFVDLPGLRTLTDEKNLQVIQSALTKSVCVIAMDFNDVDPTRIERLLAELKDIVKAMSGKTDSLLFLLNKVDDVKSTDVPVEYVINGGIYEERNIIGLKSKIQKALSLPKNLDFKIIPFVGLLLYNIELAILKDKEGKIIGYNADKLEKLLNDSASLFSLENRKKSFTPEENNIYRSVLNSLEDGTEISKETLADFENLCLNISHASVFYSELKDRIQNSFSDIIIRPALIDLDRNLQKLIADISSYININKKSSKLELFSEQLGVLKMKFFLIGTSAEEDFMSIDNALSKMLEELASFDCPNEETRRLYNRIKQDIQCFRQQIEQRPLGYIDTQIEDINNSISEITSNLIQIQGAEKINHYLNSIKDSNRSVNVFNGISSIPENIKKKLIAEIIIPFRSSIENKKNKGEYMVIASETLPSILAKDLSNQYENLYELFYTTFSTFAKSDMYYEKKAESKYSNEWEKQVSKTYEILNSRMRDVLSKRTNYYLQLDVNTFISVLNKYLHRELNTILSELKKKLKYNETDLSILIDNLMNVKRLEITVPDSLFQFASISGVMGDPGEDARWVLDYYKKHNCRADEPVYKTVYDKYFMYKCPNAKSVYLVWDSGIDKSFAPFWALITGWIKESVQSYMDNIRESALQVAEMTSSFLNEKIEKININNEEDMQAYDKMEKILIHISTQKL